MNEFNLNDLLNDSVPLFPEPLSFPTEDLIQLSQRLEQLTVKVKTQNIIIELETLKRQRLRRSFKQIKSEVFTLNQTIVQQQNENAMLREQLATLNTTIFSELACLTQRTHCCLGRIHHLLIVAIPRISMTKAEHNDLSQQASELLHALQLIRTVVYYE